MVYAKDKEIARQNNIRILGKSLSEQSLGISKAIRQVDEFLQLNPQRKNRLLESHPEFCFMMLNGGIPVMEKKLSFEGQKKRLEILKRYYEDSQKVIKKFLSDVPYRKKIDDVIDALCLAVVGKVSLKSGFKKVPEIPKQDVGGILMQIVYAKPD